MSIGQSRQFAYQGVDCHWRLRFGGLLHANINGQNRINRRERSFFVLSKLTLRRLVRTSRGVMFRNMSHGHLLCLDIETVPDHDLVPADWPADEFVRKPIWHRLVAISFVEARIERHAGGERCVVECCSTGDEASWNERRCSRLTSGTSPSGKRGSSPGMRRASTCRCCGCGP